MSLFRKYYYKIITLFCTISMFSLVFNAEGSSGIFVGCFCIITGLLSFGSWSIGKEEIDPEKPIRNIFALLLWSLLGFGIMSLGISFLVSDMEKHSMTIVFLVFAGFGLAISYFISIFKNKDYYAIASIALCVAGFVAGGLSGEILILRILTILLLLSSIVCFVLSMLFGPAQD